MAMKNKNTECERDDISETASSRAEVLTLNEEQLPDYNNATPAFSNSPAVAEKSDQTAVPTVVNPFVFPTTDLPPYAEAAVSRKPIAIPQTSQSPTAPFLDAYARDLLAYGVTEQSFSAFLSTLSAFTSAKVSQKALQHASDVAVSMGNYQKEYATRVKRSVKNIGNSAKHLNPVGVIGGALGLTIGAATHVASSILSTPGRLLQKPQTPRQRALTYLAAANKDWFWQRGLHASLVDTKELAIELDTSIESIVQTGRRASSDRPNVILSSLEKWLAPVHAQETTLDTSVPESSTAGATRLWQPQLQLGSQTLWLVLEHVEREDK
ncbi:hypothetical protein Slin15195_G046660 [Septoria linicola]|uniref:Uncharacterized protein n=1 Tax=Septoria linicola TaxID=215465 RepID=A0A9Q9EIS1_9PEZI|nr:hypothetical protein Slin15195_G046660 [Septoria linicola]